MKNLRFLLISLTILFIIAPPLTATKTGWGSHLAQTRHKGKFQKVKTITQLRQEFSRLPEGTVIFLDVDNTLITAQSALFHHNSPYRKLIDELKKNKALYPNFETILSRWRLQRKVQLVAEEWPAFVRELRERYPVYALTQMDTGPLGEIPSMEQWRYEELTRMGFVFTPKFAGVNQHVLIPKTQACPAVFFQGIFMTGASSKGEVLRVFLKTLKPAHVVLVDDLSEHLEDAERVCQEHKIPFVGILYAGKELLGGNPPAPEIAEFQKRHLLEKEEWLEDEEALALWQREQ